MQIRKYDIVLVNLDPAIGFERQGIRPCVIVQNNVANERIRTTVICPMGTVLKTYPNNLKVRPSAVNGLKKTSCVDLLQIKTIDKSRIVKKMGVLDDRYRDELSAKFFISFDLDDIL